MQSPALYSAPRDGLPYDAFAVLPRAYARAVVSRLGRVVAEQPALRAFHEDVLGALDKSLADSPGFWQPELGAALMAAREGEAQRALVQAALGLHAHAGGLAWRLDALPPTLLSFAGYRFEAAGALACDGNDRSLTLETTGPDAPASLRFERTGRGWRLVAFHGPEPSRAPTAPIFIRAAGFEDRYVVATSPAADDAIDNNTPWPPPRACADALPDEGAQEIDDALNLLSELGPYQAWISPLFRGIVGSRRKSATVTKSSSSPSQPGAIHVALPLGAEMLGCTLVHEISHQYFALANFVTPLWNDADEQTYYSSLKRLPRKIDRILVALHATGNMTLYWDDLIRLKGSTKERRFRLDEALQHTRYMGGIVDRSNGLTEAGRQLWTIQRDMITARSYELDAA